MSKRETLFFNSGFKKINSNKYLTERKKKEQNIYKANYCKSNKQNKIHSE